MTTHQKVTTENGTSYPCPACGFLVFDNQLGSYDIYPVCHWEDDLVQYKYPTMSGGANTESLLTYQKECLKQIPLDITEHNGFKRDQKWRPLQRTDSLKTDDLPQTKQGYFDAITDENLKYYWER